jgi:hypothetical protein
MFAGVSCLNVHAEHCQGSRAAPGRSGAAGGGASDDELGPASLTNTGAPNATAGSSTGGEPSASQHRVARLSADPRVGKPSCTQASSTTVSIPPSMDSVCCNICTIPSSDGPAELGPPADDDTEEAEGCGTPTTGSIARGNECKKGTHAQHDARSASLAETREEKRVVLGIQTTARVLTRTRG